MNGKGDKRRPTDEKRYSQSFEKIFTTDGKKLFCEFTTSIKEQHDEWSKGKDKKK